MKRSRFRLVDVLASVATVVRASGGISRAGRPAVARRRALALVGVLLVMSCVAGGAAARTEGPVAPAKPVLRIAMPVAVAPDPSKFGGATGWWSTVYSLAYAPIFHQKLDGTISAGLATSW